MKHKWIKRLYPKASLNFNSGEVISKIYKCLNCGLLKGNVPGESFTNNGGHRRFFPTLLYFNKEIILSKNKLPYKCEGSVFITEEEFKI